MSVTIRIANGGDIDLILDYILALATYERLAQEVRADRETLARYLFCDRPIAEVLIAELGETACGFALFFHNFSTFAGRPGIYLEDLFVDPSARGSGAGKALLRRLAQLAIERGCGRLEWAVLDWNAPAIAFYKALGAKTMTAWQVNRLEDTALVALAES